MEAISGNLDHLTEILLEHESYEVACDEIARTVDLLSSLDENFEFFKFELGP